MLCKANVDAHGSEAGFYMAWSILVQNLTVVPCRNSKTLFWNTIISDCPIFSGIFQLKMAILDGPWWSADTRNPEILGLYRTPIRQIIVYKGQTYANIQPGAQGSQGSQIALAVLHVGFERQPILIDFAGTSERIAWIFPSFFFGCLLKIWTSLTIKNDLTIINHQKFPSSILLGIKQAFPKDGPHSGSKSHDWPWSSIVWLLFGSSLVSSFFWGWKFSKSLSPFLY